MTADEVADALDHALAQSDASDGWTTLGPLLDAVEEVEAARGLAQAVGFPELDLDRRLPLARTLLARWASDVDVMSHLGHSSEQLYDYAYLNAPPPDDPLFVALATRLASALDDATEISAQYALAWGLATVARVCGRAWDAQCERAHRILLELRPDAWTGHYNYGLFLKTRGRFEESMRANQRAAELGGADNDGVIWNLAIAATGCGEGAVALDQWRRIGVKLELNAHGLPEGRWRAVQVRLAEHPLAERTMDVDAPGLEETIWVERLSPCHGRVRSALYQDLGIDYGDIVLFDGAPILTRRWGDEDVPVFPHLATLRRGEWRIYRFAGTQHAKGEIASLGEHLPGESTLYVHTEMFRILCRSCWERPDPSHTHDEMTHRVVTGKLCVAPNMALDEVARALDDAAAGREVAVYAPTLRAELGDVHRGAAEEARYQMLVRGREAEVSPQR